MTFFLILIMLAVYFVPFLVAIGRKTYQIGAIFLINFLLGWTVIAWFAALIWAVAGETAAEHLYRYGQKPNK